MKSGYRRKLIALWMIIIFIMIVCLPVVPIEGADNLYQYIIQNFFEDTGSTNAVTGIYLDYRAYDTLFETLTLLVSVIGIIHFSRHEGDY